MSTPIPDKDLAAEAVERTLEQFKGKANLEALIDIISAEAQELQATLLSLLLLIVVDSCEGAQLDGLGSIVGELRMGRDDADYRITIKARVLLNRGQGTIEDVYSTMRLILGNACTLALSESYPAAFTLTVAGAPTIDASHASAVLQMAKGAAINAQLVYQLVDDSRRFTLSSASGSLDTSSDKGLANAAQTTGGHLVGVS